MQHCKDKAGAIPQKESGGEGIAIAEGCRNKILVLREHSCVLFWAAQSPRGILHCLDKMDAVYVMTKGFVSIFQRSESSERSACSRIPARSLKVM